LAKTLEVAQIELFGPKGVDYMYMHVKHDAYMYHGQNREEAQTRKIT